MKCKDKIRTRNGFTVSGVKLFQAICQAYCNQINGKDYILDMYVPLESEINKEQVFLISIIPYFVKNKVYFTFRFSISQKARNEYQLIDCYSFTILLNSDDIFSLNTTELFMAYERVVSFLENLPNLSENEDYRYETFWKLHNFSQPPIKIVDRIKLVTINATEKEIEDFLTNSHFQSFGLGVIPYDELSLVPFLKKGKEKLILELKLMDGDYYSSVVATKSLDFPIDSHKIMSNLIKKIPWIINLEDLDKATSCVCGEEDDDEIGESGE